MRRLWLTAILGGVVAIVVALPAAAAVGDLGEQRRISSVGPEDDPGFGLNHVELAFNATRGEYLAVWTASTTVGRELEIYGRLLGPGGVPISDQVRLSSMGPEGDTNYAARRPTVAYNPTADEYLVAWQADDNTAPLVDNETEVYVQRVSGAGAEIGTDDQRISSMGPEGSTGYGVSGPAATYNPSANEYLVTWSGDDDRAGMANDELEVFAQRLSATGVEIGTDDQRVSTAGPAGDPAYDAEDPAVITNPPANEYLLAWYADDQTASQVNNDYEIFVQRLSAAGAEVGTDDQRISAMGPDSDDTFGAFEATIAYNGRADEYLVAWSAYDSPPLDPNENEIFVQRLSSVGAEIGTDDQRISSMGPDGTIGFDGLSPTAAYSPGADEFLVAWNGDDGTPPLAPDETEIYAQRLSSAGAEIGTDDQRISVMGPDGDDEYPASQPRVEYNPIAGEYLIAWQGTDATADPAETESEAYARSMVAGDPPVVRPPDITLDGATIDLAKKLKIKGKELKIKLDAGCAEACTASAAGAVSVKPAKGKLAAKAQRLKLAPATASIAAGQTTKLTLKLKGSKAKRKKLTRKLVGAVRRGAKAKAAIAVTLTDAAGNAAVVDDAAKLKAK